MHGVVTHVAAGAMAVGLWAAAAAPDGLLLLQGQGAEGRPAYRGGGKLEFLDVSLADQVVHLAAADRIPLRLRIAYRVLETAPVLLNSRLGTEYWPLYDYGRNVRCALHTREPIDLARAGDATAEVAEAWVDKGRGPLLAKGLVGIRGHSYFLVDQANGTWLDVVDPPAFFHRPELARRLTFTLANLTRFTIAVTDVESTWTPGGPVRVRLTLTDADGEQLPVVNAAAGLAAGDWQAALATEFDDLGVPTGWLTAGLPDAAVPATLAFRATVSLMAAAGPETREVTRTVARGEGQRTPADLAAAVAGLPALPRNAAGTLRETRAVWVNPKDLMTRASVENVVERAGRAGLNTLVPDVFVRSTLLLRSPLFPLAQDVEPDFDPLACLIATAHRAGLEVHPWFCVTYRDKRFRDSLPGVEIRSQKGDTVELGADLHRPAYRDFIVNLMVGVARDYEVDGIHLDYIRTMDRCFCEPCQAEFRQAVGKPLAEAGTEDWVRWQRQAVGDIVRRTAEGVRAVKPKAILSAAVFSEPASGAAQGQDPAAWAQQGWLDLVIPMDYQMDSLAVRATESGFLGLLGERRDRLVTGLSLYTRDGQAVSVRPPTLVREQVSVVRRLGIHGYCLFEFRYLDDALVEMLRTEFNRETAVPYFR